MQLKQFFKINKKDIVDGAAQIRVRRAIGVDNTGEPVYGPWKLIHKYKHNTFTNAGRDALHAFMYTNTANGGASFRWYGLTNDATQTINAAQTALTAELDNTNGLGRKDGVNSGTATHSAGTNTTLVVITWTATGAVSAQRYGVFNASTVGTMSNINSFTATTLATTDQLELSVTHTAA